MKPLKTVQKKPQLTRRQLLIRIAIGAAILFAAIIIFRIAYKIIQGNQKMAQIVYTVGVTSISKKDVEQIVTYQSILEGDPQVKIYPTVSGKFAGNAVQEGATVYSGQDLVYINRDIVGADYRLAPVKSPIAGTVTKLYYIDNGSFVSMDRPVAEVANIYNVKVVLNVGEDDLLKIKKGMPARIYPIHSEDKALLASVYSVTPFVDRDTLSGSATIKSGNKALGLKIGMSVGIDITIGKIQAFMVPETAVIMGLDRVYVFEYKDGKAVEIPVKIGYTRDNLMEIQGERLTEGMQIVTEGAFKLYDNAKVKLAQ